MTVTESHLSKYGFTIQQANTFIMSNLSNPKTIFDTCKTYGVNNDMIAEIYGYGINGTIVKEFFNSNGFDGSQLDPVPVITPVVYTHMYTTSAFQPPYGLGSSIRFAQIDMSDGRDVDSGIILGEGKSSQQIATEVANSFNSSAPNDIMAKVVLISGTNYGIQFLATQNFEVDWLSYGNSATASILNAPAVLYTDTANTTVSVPTSLDLSSTDDTGSSYTDNITQNSSGLTISGNAAVGSTVKLYDTNGTTVLGTATANSSGIFSTDVSLSEGIHYIIAKATNNAGATSSASSSLSITVDKTAPIAHLTSVTDNVGAVQGVLTSGATTDDTSLTLAGTCESGSSVNVYSGTTLLGSATVSNTGWSYNAALSNDTTYQLNVKETDKAGNISAATSNFAVTANVVTPVEVLQNGEVSNSLRDTQPYQNIGVIISTFGDGVRVQGTATVVGKNDILTAMHVVYSPDHRGWATSVEFYFGADYNNVTNSFEDYGYRYSPSSSKFYGFLSAFTDSDNMTMSRLESQYDIAVIGVNKNIGNDLGWLGLDPNYNSGIISAKAVGYPEGSTGMLSENVNIQKDSFYNVYQSNEVIFGSGASGGPLVVDNKVIGVMSTKTSSSNVWADISSVYVDIIGFMSSNDSLIA